MTGTGPHAGDEDAASFRFDISNVARTHSVTVLVSIAVAAAFALMIARRRELTVLQPSMSAWLFAGLLQGAIGYAQYFSGVPELSWACTSSAPPFSGF